MEHANAGDQINANCNKTEADHKKSAEGGGDLPPEHKTDGKITAMRNSDESMKKSVNPTEELVMEPFSDSSTQSTPSSFNFTSSVENVKDALLRWRTKVADASKKAEDLAGNTWQHLKTAPSLTDAALGRIAQGTKLLAEGGYENIFRQTFETDPEEELQDYFACYLSTSAGPIMGVLYVSTAKLAFCSDSALPYKADDKTAWSYYKVVVPLQQLKTVNTSSCRTNAAEKYIQLISVDNHEFWYLGFFNYDTAVQCLRNALQSNNSHII